MADKGDDNTPKDVISWLVKALYEEDQSAPPGHQALNEDGRLMIIAGRSVYIQSDPQSYLFQSLRKKTPLTTFLHLSSDTTGTTLAHAIYYLTKNPHALQALQKELDTLSTTEPFTNDKLQSLPYLDAVIKETLRLKPAVPSGQPRLTPSTGLQIDEVWIPGNTIVVIPPYVLQRDERCFPSGEEFIPERWIDSEKRNLVKHDEAFFPFQVGRYACVGKQLALMQLRAVIARVAVEFDMGFAEGEDGVGFDRGSMDTFTFTLGELGVVFRERERGR
ncbi:hypothetical protein N7533_008055 [Penicillium manginii]|jgi:cytochrome P450|uniref:uncharacterized protein n=1 Tax=Penicillium manginii TaxID=203109 RepID=UPI0025473354|nr:uncharacterized protein N7533_008055 [Penicillium manginii]KAJ5751027.1 hypothetical protein N7533_008055 [Penicillium manginii]